jgi:hypothetical protein
MTYNNNNCVDNSKLWNLINKLEKVRKEKIVLTSEQRFQLCNYVYGRPYSRKILAPFI